LAFTHPQKREANVLGTLSSWPPLFYVRHAGATLMRIGSRERAMPRRHPLHSAWKQQPVDRVLRFVQVFGRAGIRSCADGPLWRCSCTSSLAASTHPKTLRVPSGQRATVHGPRATPRGGLNWHPPHLGTNAYAGSAKSKVGSFVRLKIPPQKFASHSLHPFHSARLLPARPGAGGLSGTLRFCLGICGQTVSVERVQRSSYWQAK
jgi:hypothetical protein